MNDILTRAEVADWLRIDPKQVDRLKVPYLELGTGGKRKCKRFIREDVQRWLESHRKGVAA